MKDDASIRLSVPLLPFGSWQTGRARPDSDYDVMIHSAEFAAHVVPLPLPHDEPGFYEPTVPVVYHHQKKREWSLELWRRLGGDEAVTKFYELAARKLAPQHGHVDTKRVDLSLYLPIEMSPGVWAVRLKWQESNARLDFASARLQENMAAFPELPDIHSTILNSGKSILEKCVALEAVLSEVVGVPHDEEYRMYGSLSELRRNFGRYDEVVAATGWV